MKIRTHSAVMGIAQGVVWFLVGMFMASVIVFQFFDIDGNISALAAATFICVATFFNGIFATSGAIVAARKDYLDEKLELEDADKEKFASLKPPRNPWLVAIVDATMQWPVFAAAGIIICLYVFQGGLSKLTFGLVSACVMGAHGGLVGWRTADRELLKLIAHPPEEPMTFREYLWNEHILGNAIVNMIINFGFGYIIFHPGPKYTYSPIKMEHFLIDIFIMSAIVAILVSIGAAMQSVIDLRAKRTLGPEKMPKNVPNIGIRVLAYFGMAFAMTLVCGGVFYILGLKTFTLLPLMIIKGIIAAIIAGAAAAIAAYWSAARFLSTIEG